MPLSLWTHILKKRSAERATVRYSLEHDGSTSGRFSGNRHSGRIAAKQCNILLNPFQSESLVHDTSIDKTFPEDFVRREEAERSKLWQNELHQSETKVVNDVLLDIE